MFIELLITERKVNKFLQKLKNKSGSIFQKSMVWSLQTYLSSAVNLKDDV